MGVHAAGSWSTALVRSEQKCCGVHAQLVQLAIPSHGLHVRCCCRAQNKAYVGELDKMLAQNNEMLERVRELTVVQV